MKETFEALKNVGATIASGSRFRLHGVARHVGRRGGNAWNINIILLYLSI